MVERISAWSTVGNGGLVNVYAGNQHPEQEGYNLDMDEISSGSIMANRMQVPESKKLL